MFYNVDDPYCHYEEDVDGTTIITYKGHLGTWEDEKKACLGVNLLGANVTIIVLALLLVSAVGYRAIRYALQRGWTLYNNMMVLGAVMTWMGLVIELYGVSDWFQFGGQPDWGHLPKVFWYASALTAAVVQGFRIQFILITKNRPQQWKRPILMGFVAVGVVLGMTAFSLFMVGVANGSDNVPISPFVPYILFLLITGLIDTVLSVYILRICANNVAVLNAFDKFNLTASTIDAFVRQNRIAAALALTGDVIFVICFLLGGLFDFGYTFSYLSTLGLPVQFTFLLHSLYCLRKTQEAKRGVGRATAERSGWKGWLRTTGLRAHFLGETFSGSAGTGTATVSKSGSGTASQGVTGTMTKSAAGTSKTVAKVEEGYENEKRN
ncbi:hypothetical protein BC832DRAFT_595672 [Gaertneriomyces semiglobifer]|nr:hypothetical protein BC832DRAFT_595672 [Gaertneriomyces semiglobifer]